MRDGEGGPDYWSSEILEARSDGEDSTWYRYMEEIYGELIDRAMPKAAGGPSLKTDLYEEARGAYTPLPRLPEPRIGIDRSPEIVAIARQNADGKGLACELLAADVRDLPFPDGHFQSVLSGSTLDHFERREDILASLHELNRVLAPGGVLILTLDNPHNPMLLLRRRVSALSRLRLRPYFIGETLSAKEGVAALQKAGFEVRSVRAVAHAPRDPAMRLARLGEQLSSGSSGERFVRALLRFEALEHAPSRWRTGYYLAFEAVKPTATEPVERGPSKHVPTAAGTIG